MSEHVISDVEGLFHLQRGGVERRRVAFGLAERLAALAKLADAVRANEKRIVAALAADFGKPEAEVILTEMIPLLQEIKHTSRHLRSWMKPKRVSSTLATFGTSAKVEAQPRGVCLIIAPWNYPFNLAFGPLVSCLAAGNSAIIKPSEMTPATSALVADIAAKTFSPDLVAVVEGGKEVSQALLALPFDHIFFTGSPAVGRIVMEAAAKNLASVTLELGGKSPTIIGPDADIDLAVKWVTFGKFANAGQTCIAPDHVYVHQSVRDRFVEALRARIARVYGQGSASPYLAKIVNDQHAERLSKLMADAVDKGAKIVLDGGRDARSIGPTLIEAVTPEMEISRQEIFGPVLPLIAYDDLDEVLARINAGPKPLALYIFDKDSARTHKIITETSSGGVGVNLTVAHYTHTGLPFGGVNNSGIGAAHGHYGFRAFSHERAVLSNRFSALPMIFPPYTGTVKRLVGVAKRVLG